MKKSKISSIGLSVILFLGLVLATSNLSAQAQRGGGVPAEALPQDLKGMDIKDSFVPSLEKKVGVIHALKGSIVVIHNGGKAFFGQPGDVIFEKDSLNTLAESRCRIRFDDDNVVTMAADTQFKVDSFEDKRKEEKKTSVFSMLKGKAMFYALRLFRYKETKFRLKTPTAVVGVRGTKFGAHVYWLEEEKRANAGIQVADIRKDFSGYLAQAPGGNQGESVTIVAAGDGQLDVNNTVLNPGDVFNTMTNQRTFDPSVLDSIEISTQIPQNRVTKLQTEQSEKQAETEEAGVLTAAIDRRQIELDPKIEEVSSQQTATKTEDISAAPQTKPTRFKGYFSGMLIDTLGADYVDDVFVSESLQDFGSSTVRAEGLVNEAGDDRIEGRGNSPVYLDPHLQRVVWMNGARDSGDLGTNYPIGWEDIGYNSYQVWGYWYMSQEFTASGIPHYFDNKGYFIYGEETLQRPTNGSYTYSGSAWGTYFTTGTGQDMTGTFSSSINLATGSISDFDMSVSGGDKGAEIKNATGSFSGSQFTIDKSSGEWILTNGGSTFSTCCAGVDYRGAHGSLYGPDGEYIGGAWAMKHNSTNAAVGIIQGSQSSQ